MGFSRDILYCGQTVLDSAQCPHRLWNRITLTSEELGSKIQDVFLTNINMCSPTLIVLHAIAKTAITTEQIAHHCVRSNQHRHDMTSDDSDSHIP